MNLVSLSGDGVFGAHTATILQRLGQPVVDRADVFAGTSIGGMIALALAAGKTVDDCVTVCQNAQSMFTGGAIRRVRWLSGGCAKYDDKGRRAGLTELLGNRRLRDLKRYVVIQAFDVTAHPTWEPVTFSNLPGSDTANELAVTAGMATSAALTYFPCEGPYTDGGMVANDPSMIALGLCFKSLSYMKLFSIGREYPADRVDRNNWDAGWRSVLPIVDMLRTGNQALVDMQCRQILGDRYFKHVGLVPEYLGTKLDDYDKVPGVMHWAAGLPLDRETEWLKANW